MKIIKKKYFFHLFIDFVFFLILLFKPHGSLALPIPSSKQKALGCT